MLNAAELEQRVKEVADATFAPGAVLSVHCTADVDHEGDPVVWVRVVMRDSAVPLEPAVMLSFGTKLRLAFDDWGEAAYPMTYFYSESEYGKRTAAAA